MSPVYHHQESTSLQNNGYEPLKSSERSAAQSRSPQVSTASCTSSTPTPTRVMKKKLRKPEDFFDEFLNE